MDPASSDSRSRRVAALLERVQRLGIMDAATANKVMDQVESGRIMEDEVTEKFEKLHEVLEDSPSLVAHSVHRRILRKDGLLFVVRVCAQRISSITPELVSRASYIVV